jgi:putative ABC transport system permease protein
LSLLVGLAAGFYPAILLSNYPAAAVLASARSPGGGRVGTRTREVLVVFQFGLAIAFMIGTVVLVAQTHHLRKTDLGFNRDGLFVVTSLADSNISQAQAQTLLEAFRAMPEVRQVGVANSAAGGSGENNADNVPLPGVSGEGPSLRSILVSPGFFEAYKPRLVAGRLFDEVHGADDATGWSATNRPRNIVINQKAVSVLGFASPQDAVGKTVGGEHPRTIIGVIDQMRFFSPRLPDDATYFVYQREIQGTRVATLRFAGDPREFKEKLRGVWQRLAPQVPFNGDTADNRLAKLYEADEQATRLFSIGAALAVLIGCVGLWGLASFNTTRRIKEIGIRKTLGASTGDIGKLLIGQFLRPVLLANLIAWPLAWIAMRTWLAGFDDRIALSPIYFIAASIIALAIAILTVFGQSLRASRSAPAWALRHE